MPQPARTRGRQVNAFQALALLLSFVLVAAVGGVLTAGLVLPGVAIANGVTDMSVEAFDDLPTALEESPLPQKSRILANDGTVLATFFDQNREVVPLDQISKPMQNAVIATEDKRFYEHAGVDVMGMFRAAARNVLNTSQEGASTLTQQYVKNVLIEAALQADTEAERQEGIDAAREAEGADGVARKLREAKLAITLEKTMSKEEILEKYLNIAQFGSSVYGVEAAAQRYFGVPAAKLDYLQAATIAGITQSPSAWDPVLNPEDSQTRRDTVLYLLHQQDYITDAQYKKFLKTPLEESLNLQPSRLGCMSADDVVPGSGFFCDYVTKVIANDSTFGKTPQARRKLLMQGGLTIYTTLDPKRQAAADKEVKAGVPVKDKSGVGSAISVVEPGTGEIWAMAQNRDYNNTDDHGPRETAVNFNTDNKYGSASGFPPGSTFKPFTLLEWLKEGHSLQETIDGRRMSYPLTDFNAPCTNLGTETYEFGNAEGNGGVMSVLDATRNSVNSAYIAMASQLNLCNIFTGAAELGVHRAGGQAGDGDFQTLAANVLGTDSVAPLSMAGAFATFASGGIYCEPIAITKVTNAQGKKLKVPDAGCHQAIDKNVAAGMAYALSNVWTGTAKSVAKPAFAAAGKTGTTSHNEHTWFVGFTPRLSAAVWVGYPNGMRPMQGATIDGVSYNWAGSGPWGSSIAAPTWVRFMNTALRWGTNPEFEKPDDKLIYGERIGVPWVVGMSEQDARNRLYAAGFKVTVSSERVKSGLPAGAVAEQTPSGTAVRGALITLRLSDGSQVEPPDPCKDGKGPGCDDGGDGPGKDKGNGDRGSTGAASVLGEAATPSRSTTAW
ncbi:penicillin-binding protein [Cellulomonas sp.]|uniref:penicillin-binding protein n=1 Tax=Cellulomonas sp. TaxID=40001 RepID=UPI002585F6D4|nr:penicillin-binding protein [Cellulomonas sp.]MCR6688930.1 penicillin-binding protein [Cellulomonas sp.]